jgi:hypothetical protein
VHRKSNRPDEVSRVADLMSTFDPMWCLCGGWGVDAWLGHQSRAHDDVDIALFQEDQRALFQHLRGWRLVGHEDHVDPGTTELWKGRRLELPAHIHARAEDGFDLEILLNERSDDGWILRREPYINMPLSQAVRVSGWKVPTVVPEVLLFWKATAYLGVEGVGDRSHDEVDFRILRPSLTERQVSWLRASISAVDPGHAWLPHLAPNSEDNAAGRT